MSPLTAIAAGSIAIGVLVFLLKLVAWRLTGSVALYSDAVESVVNVVAASAALYAVHLAQQPPDKEHPYGHHKAEYFAAVLEGALILAAAFAIFTAAYQAFGAGGSIAPPWEGVAVNLLAAAINAAWCWKLMREGAKRRSPALLADGRHLLTDVISSVGVLFGLIAAYMTGLPWMDPLLACLVALNILWSGTRLIRESVGGLMDEAVNPKVMASIRNAISDGADGAIEAHDLRSRVAGSATFIEFHLVVPASMTVGDSHTICDRIEASIRNEVEGAVITIHVEPPEKAKHKGVVVV
ncbi:MAG: cation transporter [Methylocystis sp.]|nr:cation transporter [Methylocystis sp.]MCA3585375.1 cation transporter [Methylocystis sp.]MCA3588626.1 cation transporter [Methylocystis sp.]MCA3591826.1 cation transporter [Methylocystis sp.]